MNVAELFVFGAFFVSIALAFSPSLQAQFTLPKLFWLRASATAIGLLWALRVRIGAIKPIPAAVAAPAVALVVWWLITIPFAVHVHTDLWGASGRYNGVVNQVTLLLLFFAVASMQMSRERVLHLVVVFVAALVPLALYALVQGFGFDHFVWPNPRPGSTIGHPVPLAAILSLGLPFALAFSIAGFGRAIGWLWLVITILLLFAIGTTLSRGPWVGAAIAVIIVLLAATRTRTKGPRRAWMFFAALALAAVATVWLGRIPGTRVSQRITQLTRLRTDPSFMNRFVFFEAASAMVRDHPVTGVGFESFGLLYPRYRPVEGEAVPEDTVPSMVHNSYLQLAVTTGVCGLMLYLSLIAGVLVLLIRTARGPSPPGPGTERERVIAAAFVGAVAGYLVQDLSGWPEISLSAFFWTIAALAVSYSTDGRSEASSKIRGSGRPLLAGLAVAVSLATGVLAYCAFQDIRADRALATASRLDVTKNWPDISARLTTALDIAGHDAHYLDEAGVMYLRRFYAAGDDPTYRQAVVLFERAESIDPFDPYALIHRIDLEAAALRSGLVRTPSAPALAAVETALDLDANNSSVHEAVARFELAAGRPSNALKSIEIARTLRPTHSGYRIVEGDIRRALGEKSRAIDAYRSELPLHHTPDEAWVAAERKLVASLVESADYRSAVAEGLEFVKRLPGDATSYVLLGVAYRGLQDVESAKGAFAAALAIDPTSSAAQQGHREAEQQLERLRDTRGAPPLSR